MWTYGILVVLSCAFLATAAASQDSCRFRPHDGVIKAPFRGERNVTARSIADCTLKSCRCGSRCVASFNPTSGLCIGPAPLVELLSQTESNSFIQPTPGERWMTYEGIPDSQESEPESPSGLWLLDSNSRCRNFGSKGLLLDCPIDGLKWTEESPRGHKSELKYLTVGLDFFGIPKIQIRHRGNFLIDFKRPFTIAAWVMVNRVNTGYTHDRPRITILDGHPLDSVALSLYVDSFYESAFVAFDHLVHHYLSSHHKWRRNEWGHIAVVYYRQGKIKLYLNGRRLRVRRIYSVFSVKRPEYLCLLYPCNLLDITNSNWIEDFLPKSVACLAIYERALSMSSISDVMRKCP